MRARRRWPIYDRPISASRDVAVHSLALIAPNHLPSKLRVININIDKNFKNVKTVAAFIFTAADIVI